MAASTQVMRSPNGSAKSHPAPPTTLSAQPQPGLMTASKAQLRPARSLGRDGHGYRANLLPGVIRPALSCYCRRFDGSPAASSQKGPSERAGWVLRLTQRRRGSQRKGTVHAISEASTRMHHTTSPTLPSPPPFPLHRPALEVPTPALRLSASSAARPHDRNVLRVQDLLVP